MIVSGSLKMNPQNKVDIFIPQTPVSTQHAYVNRAMARGKMIRFLSKDAKAFKELVQSAFNTKYGPLTDGKSYFGDIPLRVMVTLNFKTRRKSDWDNYHKLWCDALEGLVYDNDTQIFEAIVHKEHSPLNPGIHIIVEPL